jgi:cell division protein FtsW
MTRTTTVAVQAPSYDVQLLFAVLFLVGIGIVMVYSASSALALKKYGSDFYFLKKQALFSLFGIMALVTCRHIPFRCYRVMTYPLLALALGLLVAVHVSGLGLEAGGSLRWLRLGPLTFQPVEVARLALIVFMAYSLNKKQAVLGKFTLGFVPHVIVLASICRATADAARFRISGHLRCPGMDHDVHGRRALSASAFSADSDAAAGLFPHGQ